MEKPTIKASKREVVGKKVKKLRKDGLLPASLFGKKEESLSLSVPVKEFALVYKTAGETGLVTVEVGSKKYPALISNVTIHPVSRQLVHAQFHVVSLTEKIKANVPVVLEGESPAVANGVGLVLQTLNEVEVEALPADLPEHMTAKIETLVEVDQQLTVADLLKIKEVDVLTPAEEVVARVAPAVTEEAKKEAEAAAAAEAAKEMAAEAPATPTPEVPKAEEPAQPS